MGPKRIDHCLACGYDLQGLPEDHACPECGLQFRRLARVFRGPRHLADFFAPAPGLLQNMPLVRIVYSVILLFRARRLLSARRYAPIAAIDESAVILLDAKATPTRIEFVSIGDSCLSELDGCIYIKDPQGGNLGSISVRAFESRSAAAQFLGLLQAGIQRTREETDRGS